VTGTNYIIGIDPGTACGWAVLREEDGERVASGVWDLRPRRHEGGGMRYLRVRRYLRELLEAYPPVEVAYEEVRAHLGVDAAHVYGGIVAAVTGLCEEVEVPYEGVPVATIKRTATGKGNAAKPAVKAAAVTRWGEVADDNEADALWVAEVARGGRWGTGE